MQPILNAALTPSVTGDGNGIYKTIPSSYIQSYSHVISAFGGFDSCQMSLFITKRELEHFLINVLGSSMRVYSGEAETIWEGFVNEITLTYNNSDITVGPLLDISNKVLVRYTEYTTGVPGITTYANNIASQKRYGTIVKILAAAQVSATNANNIRDDYIEINRNPAYGVGLTNQPQGDLLSVTINGLGNYHILSTYVYNNPLETVYTVRQKIIDVLASQPNNLFTNRYANIARNNLSVSRLEDEDRLAVDVIKELVALGSDTSNDRMLFGIYENNTVRYQNPLEHITQTYFLRNYVNNKYIQNVAGGRVNIASFKPGRWVIVADIPDVMNAKFHSNPKFIFAESVNYTAPYGLSITSSNVSTLEQKLAKLGLGGLG